MVHGGLSLRRGAAANADAPDDAPGAAADRGAQTSRTLDRYLRLRRARPRADSPAFWLGARPAVRLRGALPGPGAAGAGGPASSTFIPHVLRHRAAQRRLSADGSEGGLMAVAGWKRRDMLDRYTQATAAERAATEARQLNLGGLDYCSPPWPGCWLEPRSRGVEGAYSM